MAEKIGFIGLGIMGRPMAENLIEAGYDLVAYNRTREKAEELDGATVAESPKEVAGSSDVIITMLPDSPQVEEVLAGEDGVLEGLREGALFVDMSTISPVVTEELSDEGERTRRLDARRAGLWRRRWGHRRDALHHGRRERGGLRAGASALRGHGRRR